MYYQLFVKQDGEWLADFGDKDKEAVDFERQDIRDKGAKAKDIKLVSFKRVPTGKQVLAMQTKLNEVTQ